MESIQRTKFNISILGESQVGKTSMISVKTGLQFNEKQISTVGIDNFIDKKIFDNKEYKFKFFDTAGQERYNSISAQTIKIADGFILVFSVTDRGSLEKISFWMKSIEENTNIKDKVIILVGNKIDMEREISHEEANNFAKENNLKYFETSAKTGYGIDETFNQLYQDIYELNKKDNPENEKNKNIQLENTNNDEPNEKGKKKSKCC